jgi:hypothetical protein
MSAMEDVMRAFVIVTVLGAIGLVAAGHPASATSHGDMAVRSMPG